MAKARTDKCQQQTDDGAAVLCKDNDDFAVATFFQELEQWEMVNIQLFDFLEGNGQTASLDHHSDNENTQNKPCVFDGMRRMKQLLHRFHGTQGTTAKE